MSQHTYVKVRHNWEQKHCSNRNRDDVFHVSSVEAQEPQSRGIPAPLPLSTHDLQVSNRAIPCPSETFHNSLAPPTYASNNPQDHPSQTFDRGLRSKGFLEGSTQPPMVDRGDSLDFIRSCTPCTEVSERNLKLIEAEFHPAPASEDCSGDRGCSGY